MLPALASKRRLFKSIYAPAAMRIMSGRPIRLCEEAYRGGFTAEAGNGLAVATSSL